MAVVLDKPAVCEDLVRSVCNKDSLMFLLHDPADDVHFHDIATYI